LVLYTDSVVPAAVGGGWENTKVVKLKSRVLRIHFDIKRIQASKKKKVKEDFFYKIK